MKGSNRGPDPSLPLLSLDGSGSGVQVDLEQLLRSRLILQAGSGGGKSFALRYLLEQTHGQVPQLILDWEGEFASLRERFAYVYAAVRGGDVAVDVRTAAQLCRRLVELGASAIIDLYDLSRPARRRYARLFLEELMALPRNLWRPMLVVLDEGHELAPEGGHGESEALAAVVDLCSKGRKRGYCPVVATQRLGKFSKDAAAELQNKLIGLTTLDTDMKRAGEDLGFDKPARRELAVLNPGEFFAVGPAISREVVKVRTGAVRTSHPEAGKVAPVPPPAPAAIKVLLEQLRDLPQEAEERERTVEALEKQVQQFRAELAAAKKAQPPPAPPKPVEVPILGAADRERLDELLKGIRGDLQQTTATMAPLQDALRSIGSSVVKAGESFAALAAKAGAANRLVQSARAPSPFRPQESYKVGDRRVINGKAHEAVLAGPGNDGLSAPQQRILNVLADFETLGLHLPPKSPVAVFSGASPTSSAYANNLGRLRALGLIEYGGGGTVGLSAEGRARAVSDGPPLTTENLHAAWRSKLPGPQWAILAALVESQPDPLPRDELAARAGASPTSSAFANNLGALRSLGLLDYRPGRGVVATDLLFLGGRR